MSMYEGELSEKFGLLLGSTAGRGIGSVNSMKCLYCNSSQVETQVGFLLCKQCRSLTCTDPLPANTYNPSYHAYRISWFRPKIYFLRAKSLACGLRKNITIADVGCGAGHALYWAKRYGCKTVGYDISSAPNSADAFYSDLNEMVAKQNRACDVVWCWHTLEHTESPRELLKSTFEILKPGGKLYLECPEANMTLAAYPMPEIYKAASFPEHRGIPSTQWINQCSTEIGFKIEFDEVPLEGRWLYPMARDPMIARRFVYSR